MSEEDIKQLLANTRPESVTVEGRVLSVSLDGRFRIVQDGNEILALAGDAFPLKQLGLFLGQEVRITGTALRDRQHHLALLIGTAFTPLPSAGGRPYLPGESPEVRQLMASRLASVIGKWPGAQSDAEELTLPKPSAGNN